MEKETIPNQNQEDSFYWGLHAAENENIQLEMLEKSAWVVTDWINGACGMERKETTEAVRC